MSDTEKAIKDVLYRDKIFLGKLFEINHIESGCICRRFRNNKSPYGCFWASISAECCKSNKSCHTCGELTKLRGHLNKARLCWRCLCLSIKIIKKMQMEHWWLAHVIIAKKFGKDVWSIMPL